MDDNDISTNRTTAEAADRERVAALLRNDPQAWERMLADVARPLAATKKYREMTARLGLSLDDVLSQLCEELYRDDFARLRAFRFDGSFEAFLYWEVRNCFRVLMRRNTMREETVDHTDEAFAFGDALVSQPDVAREALEEARSCFVDLWRENAVGAYALLLKDELGVDSKTVARLLGKTPNTVDKIASRAHERMRELRQILVSRGS